MDCKCEPEDATAGWLSNNMQMGSYAVVGYLFYRFSQTLPALIRWPIRIFCSLTGLSALWSWVSRLVRTLTGIGHLFKWLSRVWRFIEASSSKFSWLIDIITGTSRDRPLVTSNVLNLLSGNSTSTPDLRLIVLGPANRGQTSLLDNNVTPTRAPAGPLTESTKRGMIVDGGEITVIDTPDLLGLSLLNDERAREALRSLQLASPGPHAFLLVIQVPGSNTRVHQDASRAIQATLELFGEGVSEYIVPVLTHTDHLDRTVEQLLDADGGSLRRALSRCSQRPELVDNRSDCPLEKQNVMRRQLVGRVTELKELRGHFIHELQGKENRIREELLADTASALARKLGHM